MYVCCVALCVLCVVCCVQLEVSDARAVVEKLVANFVLAGSKSRKMLEIPCQLLEAIQDACSAPHNTNQTHTHRGRVSGMIATSVSLSLSLSLSLSCVLWESERVRVRE